MKSRSTSQRREREEPIKTMQATWLGETTALVQFLNPSATPRKAESTSRSASHTRSANSSRRSSMTSATAASAFLSNSNSMPTSDDTINVLFNPSIAVTRKSSSSSTGPSFSLLNCGFMPKKAKRMMHEPANDRRLEGLPEIHYVCISDTHYENLDAHTILGLHKRDNPRFIVPRDASASLIKLGIPTNQITEIQFMQSEVFTFPHNAERSLRISCIPSTPAYSAAAAAAEHTEKSTMKKGESSLLSSKKVKKVDVVHWVVKHEKNSAELSEKVEVPEVKSVISATSLPGSSTVLFAASSSRTAPTKSQPNTAVNQLWRDVQSQFGPIDLAFIPVWTGQRMTPTLYQKIFNRKSLKQTQDFAPIEAAEVHQILRSGISIAMLHGIPAPSSTPLSPFSDDDDEHEHDKSSTNTSEAAVQAIAQLKSACDRSERRSVEFRRGTGSLKRKKLGAGVNVNGARGGKSTFAVISEGQSIAV